MAEYIDREKVLVEMDWYIEKLPDCAACLKARRSIIAHIPVADVQPVKRGEWIALPHEYNNEAKSFACSRCGRMQKEKTPYCAKCGAKMEEETCTKN